ncbi:hypothetical protein ALP29_200137 [Pseudomonas syringae pv. avii]|uniref:Uncharacterized protein n=1 Tax=Pseudomonas syringae pv. avii TaxID=663959 RepID=A0A3M5UMF3_PSESX|nr:hypothetical protein ALP29_200137 [Pseudomonas syringae pv. avii]
MKGQVIQLVALYGNTLEAGGQCAVADEGDNRGVHRLATHGQNRVGDPRLDVAQTHLAPLTDCIAVAVCQGTVGAACKVIGVTVQRNGVVQRQFGGETYNALGITRGVVDDGALLPVDTARSLLGDAVIVVAKNLVATLEFVGVPVTGCPGQVLVFDKAVGVSLCVLGTQLGRYERLACRFSLNQCAER